MENDKTNLPKFFLTFDDGPNEPYTSQILDILKNFQVKASFFVCGKNAERFPDSIKRIVSEGHAVGNHSYSHSPILSRLGLIAGEIEKTSNIISQVTGIETKFFRPPWGFLTPWLKYYLKSKDYKVILWDIKARDWNGSSPEVIRERIISKAKPNAIVMAHDGYDGFEIITNGDRSRTVKALPEIIKDLQRMGYILASIKELSEDKFYKL